MNHFVDIAFNTIVVVMVFTCLFYYVRSFLNCLSKKTLSYGKFLQGGLVLVVLVTAIVGMNLAKQHVFATTTDYENPQQKQRNKKIVETKAPIEEQIEENSNKERNRLVELHKDKLNAFDEAMKKETEKIKERNHAK